MMCTVTPWLLPSWGELGLPPGSSVFLLASGSHSKESEATQPVIVLVTVGSVVINT